MTHPSSSAPSRSERIRARPLPAALALAAALVVGLIVAPRIEAQARTVVITTLEGRGANAGQRAIATELTERGFTITTADAAPADDAAAASLARERGADALIGGSLTSRGGTWRAELWVRDAAGRPQGDVRRRARGRRGPRELAGALAEILARIAPAGVPVQTAASVETAQAAMRSGVTPAEAPPPSPFEVPASAVDAPSTPPASAPATPPPASDAGQEPFPIRATVLVGAGVRSRAFELLSPDGLDAAYRAEPFFEAVARANVRFLDAIFVRGAFGSSIGLETDREEARLGTLETWFAHALVDAGASFVIGDTVELGLAFGLSWERYQLAFNEVVPTAEYVSLRPALVSGFRLVGEALVLDAEIGVRVPLGVGDLEAIHGVRHRALGLDGAARLGGVIDPGFVWGLEVGARHTWLRFDRPDGRAIGFDAGWHATALAGWRF